MRIIAELFTGLFMAAVFLAGILTFGMGVSEPEKRGTLAIAGAVLIGSMMITLAIVNQSDEARR
jgi:hypothetical protein